MLFKRRAYDRMKEWKREAEGSRALLVEGARRVGKSTLVEEFAKREYAHHLIIDFSEASEELKELFTKAVPDYDGDRFYVSHMKKVVDWYNELKNFASLEFVEEGEAEETEQKSEE